MCRRIVISCGFCVNFSRERGHTNDCRIVVHVFMSPGSLPLRM